MNDEYYMNIALNLAKTVSGQTSPNPPVGSVVVKNGEMLGFGAHLKAGEAHAEAHALNMAGDKAKGATIYVTLEPCSHHGRTPPCADLIVNKEISRAVIAVTDPNEKVAGRGIEKLQAAGIEVELGVLEKEAAEINSVFFHYTNTKTPYVTMKSAVSLDGKTATVTGDSKWITGEAARLDVHHYRHTHDAILVGVETVIADNPSLTTRIPNDGKNPTRVILDTSLRTPLDAAVINDQEADTWLFTGKDVTEKEVAPFKEKNGVVIVRMEQLTIENVLYDLGSKGIMSLFVEGGATVNGSFLEERRINQLITYIAPKLIGGKTAPTSIEGNGFQSMADTFSLDIKDVEMIDKDIKIIAELGKEEADVYRNN
ncbi:bifunctional diaminohydroxyphosphoribosylaminopyrimidine deaminase/5-amino-6-(5-phosphoribosylamino)uracil reductase RibD [Virgibacillus litoralis]|uniref:Riboflavin biosynthesis protein RibD n=1 Tax=Virgibacillus litoralis TaxID=578221 RepID=A0ABS4HC01_9BACI|nr:bifunctional diaminohydroxyphosphoribosylaminopyrimidine deaminase/5-amino-6-(5-phosphoribosylamino)uracil reductase RibD [Virgibacillus litoralis]MBP1948179.1 diaminohydroxyphosphoribosylaminopyrimidine deaminase/5-amino-6-(5-phosphoribosylamino)uracil reductase [Virgibacillus litoralis]